MFRHAKGLLAVIAALLSSYSWPAPEPLRTVEEMSRAMADLGNEGHLFDISGCIQTRMRFRDDTTGYTIRSGSSKITIYEHNGRDRSGDPVETPYLTDTVRLRGKLEVYKNTLQPRYNSVELLAKGNLDALPLLTPLELSEGRNDGGLIRLKGVVRAAARDDSDAAFIHMTLRTDQGTAQVMIHNRMEAVEFTPLQYLGAEVMIYGISTLVQSGIRQHAGHILVTTDIEDVIVLTPPNTAETAPGIEMLTNALPQQIAALGLHRADGSVLAIWSGNAFLMKTAHGAIVRVDLQDPHPPPCGAGVRVVGLPTTDTYHINLRNSTWHPKTDMRGPLENPVSTEPADLLTNARGAPQLMVRYHGKSITLRGCVRYLSKSAFGNAQFQIESGGFLIPIAVSAFPGALDMLNLGDEISATGVCVMNAENWMEAADGERRNFFLVPRTPADIVILSRTPWWTPRRLTTLLCLFAAGFLGVVGWNMSLNRRAKAKGRELAAEQLAHVTSELKVNERTRLAVELHDALSQTLTGVSMQIDTAASFAEGKFPAITKCLNLASRTIDACRTELRNTLWDLRSAALDETSMDAAIRKTLCQNLAGIDLTVRFNVPRETFSDNTAHAILKIIRELAANALRHGKASSLKIAGASEGDLLLFSVKDNGCGFDPDLAPGIAQGHFGLQGVAERLERLNGEMKIESSKGKGTKVTVTLPFPHSGE